MNKKYILNLNNVDYDLSLIKKTDKNIFLNGCKMLGNHLKKWYNPFYNGMVTKEYLKAIKIFKKIEKEGLKE